MCGHPGDQICGVGLSVRFNSHLITIWHRDSSKQKSVDGLLSTVLAELPDELAPKPDNYFYKRHCDHPGFNPPPELKAVLDSHNARVEAARAAADKFVADKTGTSTPASAAATPTKVVEGGEVPPAGKVAEGGEA